MALLFVYGTLRRDAGHPMHGQLAALARHMGQGRVQACLYEVNGYPAAVPTDDPQAWVEGELYRFDDAALLDALDAYEECSARFTEPHEYRREQAAVLAEDGSTVIAWAYLYNRDPSRLERIHGGDYLVWLQAQRWPSTRHPVRVSGPVSTRTNRCCN